MQAHVKKPVVENTAGAFEQNDLMRNTKNRRSTPDPPFSWFIIHHSSFL
jgi:hypothetical protein